MIFDKFEECTKVICIKSWVIFEKGKVYNYNISYDDVEFGGVQHKNIRYINIEMNNAFFGFPEVNKCEALALLENFVTVSEHRKSIIEELL